VKTERGRLERGKVFHGSNEDLMRLREEKKSVQRSDESPKRLRVKRESRSQGG
jgi:hypothetical protein